MPYPTLTPVRGVIQNISRMQNSCCTQLMTLQTADGIIRFIITPDTFVVNSSRLQRGMTVFAFYDADRPVPLIYPPQYQAEIITQAANDETVTVSFFDSFLLSADGSLKLNIGPRTSITTANGQRYTCSPGGNLLIVYYTSATKSIPAQATPRKIIVFCS